VTVEELRQLLDGVDGDRLVYVQVLAARREAVRTYSENGSRMVGNPITDEARLEYTRAFIISA